MGRPIRNVTQTRWGGGAAGVGRAKPRLREETDGAGHPERHANGLERAGWGSVRVGMGVAA